MKITKVEIRRYRAFDRQVTIPLRDFTVVTGPNNLGKSTVLSALELFFSYFERRSSRIRRVGSYSYDIDYPKRYQGRSGRRWPTEISVEMELDEQDVVLIKGELDHDLEPTIKVTIKFEWDDLTKSFRARYYVSGVPKELHEGLFVWLADHVRYVYISAERGVTNFRRTIYDELVSGALARISRSKQRLQALERLFEDVKAEIAVVETELVGELRQYLPSVKELNFSIDDWSLERLVSVNDVIVDDGAKTLLRHKGDGFKSLFSMSLLQYVATQKSTRNLIFAIEEPEAHLHSSAIYEIKDALRKLSSDFQIICTTHSPILIQRDDVKANVIVESSGHEADFYSTARAAGKLEDIRKSLGIKPHENMTTAEVVIVVEGASEETVLPSVLGRISGTLATAFACGRVKVLSAGGAANIPAVVRALARDAATCLVFVDGDDEGRAAARRVGDSGHMLREDIFEVAARADCPDTELEDLFAPEIYLNAVSQCVAFQITPDEFRDAQRRSGGKGRKCAKWSAVMERILGAQGMQWDALSDDVKAAVAAAIAEHAKTCRLEDVAWARGLAGKVARYLSEVEEAAQA
ncbi:ATP-dependent nuclease [Burkholderia multivorans]|uniref:ATP-dependent nuclease n=1 Tax=Burkholderia multivorans TaxID=87883 RepID=UPI0009E0CB34|nr:AAA family ATPase [Burkholderia multivorans]MBU9261714.1 AAA family ATPase [Burkholderia multivorans]MBU9366473.1 AAA family ATPase [Burkholderia multivorans]MBU9490269.1 AAA family ATPase [Burkholderia multivorans]MBU9662686.1 AAA family ATPase [Burkholderia multivorans]MCA8414342.1 AAA family ATPase [Burkholderia multivorans]